MRNKTYALFFDGCSRHGDYLQLARIQLLYIKHKFVAITICFQRQFFCTTPISIIGQNDCDIFVVIITKGFAFMNILRVKFPSINSASRAVKYGQLALNLYVLKLHATVTEGRKGNYRFSVIREPE